MHRAVLVGEWEAFAAADSVLHPSATLLNKCRDNQVNAWISHYAEKAEFDLRMSRLELAVHING
jgi:hypothetical protein